MLNGIMSSILKRLGYDLHKIGSRRGFTQYDAGFLSQICTPKTVIDIGVAYGTPELYKAFPSAYFILVEPIREYKKDIDQILSKYEGEVHYKAAGRKVGSIDLNVNLANMQLSSVLDRSQLTKRNSHAIEQRTVEMTTVDKIVSQRAELDHPIILKIDTEGNELEVLRGAESALSVIDFVIAEVSVAKRFEDSYSFEELCDYMNQLGFYLYTFLSVAQSPNELRPRFADTVFAKRKES